MPVLSSSQCCAEPWSAKAELLAGQRPSDHPAACALCGFAEMGVECAPEFQLPAPQQALKDEAELDLARMCAYFKNGAACA